MPLPRPLPATLLIANGCLTRREAQAVIREADEASMKLSGVPYGIPLTAARGHD